ncbi:MAG TPA: InlB B-repeat-containing protein [Deltaproteobacteria bacterium]|nr:InlB B-repeat-containing protein [Deltaproteobacteria bacterium]
MPACGGGGGGGGGGGVKAPAYTVTYNGNGNTGGSVPVDTTNYEQGATVTVLGNTGSLTRTGYSFTGWCMNENGEGDIYTQGQTFTMGTSNVILYARWTANPTYTVTYNGNGSTGGSVPVDTTNYEQGALVTVLGNTGNLIKDGYFFAGWCVAENGEGTTYTQGQPFVMGTANVTLYARWFPYSTGILDIDFGEGGIVTTPLGEDTQDEARALAIQADGKIVVAGSSFGDFALVRYDENGDPDPTFGIGGKVVTSIGEGTSDEAFALAIQADGKIVVAGSSFGDFALVRYDENGERDPTFGADGIVTVDIETEDIAYALAIQADGKIVAAGYSLDGANADFALVRCDENGEPDQTFGTDGIVTVDIDTDDRAYALAIQDDGKIVAAGYSFDGANTDFALVRCDENGEPDQTFDTDGIVITQVASPVVLMRFDEARALAIQADGKIIAAGKSYNSTDDDFALVRYE